MYERFEKLLKEYNVTAYKVSQATGIATPTLTKWKQGDYTPKIDKLKKIADYFGVSVGYLTGEDEVLELKLSDEEREIILAFRRMTEDQKDLVRPMFGIEKDAELSDSQKGA